MSIHEEIPKAVAAHGKWKSKLRAAIDTGEAESTPEKVKMDNNCSFGIWLHERIDDQHRGSPFYRDVLQLHADFHKEAGSILELALNGDKDEANKRIGLGSNFSSISAQLTNKMTEWKESL
ncbi:hypothetical protein E4634_15280 [Mangrovimicrobium sediminis]|uniref:Chemoreceptor zinc-binding domain-containing protein n=1 Tax=Mangrovimicrobium sediminis TaxID=2562682 RepID=A0A4Z0LZ00_9GAMM|nr:CZB domain-containing protein [Haliea sp. SAOS-164]TGD72325.1 hypothetical protein E4634_15280 [Haliea sp. SAOS-164]